MNILMSILALASLVFAPSCRNLHFWGKPEPVVQTKKKSDKQKKSKEKVRKSGPEGWQIEVDKESNKPTKKSKEKIRKSGPEGWEIDVDKE